MDNNSKTNRNKWNLDKEDSAQKNKINLKIEDFKLEIEEINNNIPENWTSKNKEFEIIQKAKNTQTKRYRKNVDQAYDNLDQLVMFIKDHEKLNELSSEVNQVDQKLEFPRYYEKPNYQRNK